MQFTHKNDWTFTGNGEPRGYIQPTNLHELWLHTGTLCNMSCPFCFEHAGPGDHRIEQLSLTTAKQYMDEAVQWDIRRFCFTGGEPFVNKEFVQILDYALDHRPCLVLTNGTQPLHKSMNKLIALKEKKHAPSFRVSLDRSYCHLPINFFLLIHISKSLGLR